MSNKKNTDKSRIASLLIGFLILFVVTFSLGIIVGKGVSDRSFKAAQEDEELESGPVFSEEPHIKVIEEFQALKEQAQGPSPAPEEAPLEITKNEPKELTIKGEIVQEMEEIIPPPSEAEPETIVQVLPTPEPVQVKPTPIPEPPEEIRKAAIEEITKTDQNKREGRPKLPPIDPKGRYTVQIGSFTDKKTADSVLNSMKRKGYPAFINSMTDSDKKRWYRVRIGTFSSSQIANKYGDSLKVLEPEVKLVFITQNN